jgi:Acetyl-CoA hydrolase/transferase C-terminal domain
MDQLVLASDSKNFTGVPRPARFADPDRLADAIIARVGKTIVLGLPLGLGKANHVANALFARAQADRSLKLRIFTALTLEKPRGSSELGARFARPLGHRIFGGYPDLAYAAAQRERRLPPNVQVDEFFFQAGTRLGLASAQQSYISANYTHAIGYVLARGVNVVAQIVAGEERAGGTHLSLSCNPDITLDLLAARARGKADFLLVGQINSELPFMPGDADLEAEQFEFLLESPQTDFPLFAPPREPIDLREHAIGLNVARTVADGGTLQLGIGSLGDAVTHALILRHKHNAHFRRITAGLDAPDAGPPELRESGPFEIGLHGTSEMLVEGFLALREAGILKREVDGTLLEAAFFLGSRAFYRALRELAREERAKLRMTSVSFVNALYGDEETKRRVRVKARFVNNAMLATLLGHVISDGLENGQVVSGVGGQYNFVAQAFELEGARSIIMLPASRAAGGRLSSNIRWSYGHTTIPRHLRDLVVTEYGIADLRGKSDRDVIAAMLAIADSRFQASLLAQAKRAGKIEQSFELRPEARNNTPQRITQALGPAREQGLLPLFPFGTDFTETEQRLLPALARLREASPLALAALAARGLIAGRPSRQVRECLDRMGLDRAAKPSEQFYALLLRGALALTP